MILFFALAVISTLSAFPSFLSCYGFWPAAWFCLVPLFFFLGLFIDPWRRVLAGGFFGICFYALLVRWFVPYSLPGYLFFVLLLSVQPLIFAGFFLPPFQPRMFRLFYWPALWTASEYARRIIMRGFSWDLGCSQAFNGHILQWASLGGSGLLSFFLVLCNTCFYEAVRARKQRLFYIRALVAVNLLAWAGGAAQYYFYPGARSPRRLLRAAVVQAAVDPREKLDTWRVNRIVESHVRLSSSLPPSDSAEIIIWPETAVPQDLRQDPFLKKRVVDLCRNQGAGVLTGMAWEDEVGRLYNGAAWVSPEGAILEIYRKKYLVPFSEEQPWSGPLGAVLEKSRGKDAYHFSRGQGLGVLPLSSIRPGLAGSLGVAICSEDTISALFRRYARAGVGLMVVLLNDGWFKDPSALVQHAQNSILRAVETRCPVLRATNSGWTCLIDPIGRVHTPSGVEWMKAGAGIINFDAFSGQPPYVFIGDTFCILSAAFVIISLLLSKIRGLSKDFFMKVFLCLLGISLGVLGCPLLCEAGGVAARKQQGVRVRPQIQVQPSAPGRAGVWPASAPGSPAEDTVGKHSAPTPSLIPKQSYPESRVLTSAPGYSGAGGFDSGRGAPRADMTAEESLMQLLAVLEESSGIWIKISDVNYKNLVVSQHIERYRQEGALIRKPAAYYAQFITTMGEGNPALLSRPFSELLRLAAIMEYDFENGQNKDALARSVLGDDMYKVNRKRLGMP